MNIPNTPDSQDKTHINDHHKGPGLTKRIFRLIVSFAGKLPVLLSVIGLVWTCVWALCVLLGWNVTPQSKADVFLSFMIFGLVILEWAKSYFSSEINKKAFVYGQITSYIVVGGFWAVVAVMGMKGHNVFDNYSTSAMLVFTLVEGIVVPASRYSIGNRSVNVMPESQHHGNTIFGASDTTN